MTMGWWLWVWGCLGWALAIFYGLFGTAPILKHRRGRSLDTDPPEGEE